ncbi:MAG: hypothetical protein K5644_04930 [Lachnospiraceae bacterium]|nr:hypothetical protein [Lachnospiraceae bacterium]
MPDSNELTQNIDLANQNTESAKITEPKSKTRIVLGYVGFILALFLILFVVCMFLKMTEPVNVASLQGIYKEKNSLDVVVIGASEAYANYCAPLAYDEYGYTSYSYGVSGVPGNLYKSMLKEVLSAQSPKLVIFEMNGLLQNDYYYERQGNLHGYLDNIDGTENREEAIKYAVTQDRQDDFKLSNFLDVYHNSWQDPGKCFATLYTRVGMALEPRSNMKGYATFAKHAKEKTDEVKHNAFTDKSKMIFEDLLTYCDSCGVENVLFARFPHQNKDTEDEIKNQISEMTSAHGYEFVDFGYAKEEAGIVPIDDYYNDEHFNAKGAEKFTSFLGNYITSHYDVKSEKSEEIKESWAKSVENTKEILTSAKADISDNLGTYYYELSVYLPKWLQVK